MKLVSLLASIALGAAVPAAAQNAVRDTAAFVGPAISNASAPRPPVSAEIRHSVIPRPIKRGDPAYPRAALREGIDGSVLLEFSVDGRGHVVAPRVLEATPPGVFESAALEAVSGWHYESLGTETKSMKIRLTFRKRGRAPWATEPPSSTATAGINSPVGVAPDSVAGNLPPPAPPAASW